MRNRFFSLIAIFLNSLVRTGNCMFSYGSYKAAVVEYGTIREPFFQPDDILKYNSEEYIKFVQSASTKGASIIVFPEYGLTSTEVSTKSRQQLNGYSIEIPNLVHKPNPCINESLHKVLRLISCAASDNKIYVVVNIVEKEREGGDNIYFNTNLVFDRKGTIILKYRKANLYNETYFDEGNDLATFTTDFGVTFAILIGFDIFYKNPALDVLEEKNVTNVIYSTAWFSETPFQQALSVQAGYARATGVNLLAAGLSDPANKNGGSGIYLYDGRVAELYISPAKSSKLLVQDVPKIHIKISAVKCNNNSQTMPRFRLGGNLNVGSFSALKENLKGHYIVSLSQYSLETKSTLCNFNGLYCCKFHVVLREKLTPQDPEYKLSLFYGVRRMGTTTVGIRSCGLVACSKYEHHVCENVVSTKPRKTATFAKIEIVGTFDNRPESFDNPITLTYDMTPITEYTYCETLVGPDRVQADMKTTQNLTNLMSFGIRGRIFEYDGLGVGPITNTGTIAFANFMLLILGLISL